MTACVATPKAPTLTLPHQQGRGLKALTQLITFTKKINQYNSLPRALSTGEGTKSCTYEIL